MSIRTRHEAIVMLALAGAFMLPGWFGIGCAIITGVALSRWIR